MCTSIILFRKKHPWPLIIGSNRDENLLRKSKFPGRHWLKLYPQIIGGFDIKEKGSWIAINDHGLVSIIHNRKLEKDNNLIKKSRGHIILKLLNLDNIESAVKYLKSLNQSFYNGFNIFLGDKSHCFWGKHNSIDKKIEVMEINEGLSILTEKDLNDVTDKKINYYLNKFLKANIPDPNKNDWLAWKLLLSTKKIENQNNPEEAICFINKKNNYGTLSSSLLAISENFSVKRFKNSILFLATKQSPVIKKFINVNLNY